MCLLRIKNKRNRILRFGILCLAVFTVISGIASDNTVAFGVFTTAGGDSVARWETLNANASPSYHEGDVLASIKKPSVILYDDADMTVPILELKRYDRVGLVKCGYSDNNMTTPYIYEVAYYDTTNASVRQLKASDGILPVLNGSNINWEKYQVIENISFHRGFIYAEALVPHAFEDSEEWGRRVVSIGMSRQGLHGLYNQNFRFKYFYADCSSFTWWTLKESGIRLPGATSASGIAATFAAKPNSVIYSKMDQITIYTPDLDGKRTINGINYIGVGEFLDDSFMENELLKEISFLTDRNQVYADGRIKVRYTMIPDSFKINPNSIIGFFGVEHGSIPDHAANTLDDNYSFNGEIKLPFTCDDTGFESFYDDIAIGDVITFFDRVSEFVGFMFTCNYTYTRESFTYCVSNGSGGYNCSKLSANCNGTHKTTTSHPGAYNGSRVFRSFTFDPSLDENNMLANLYRITHVGIYAGDGMSIDNTGGMLTGNLLHCTSGEDSRGRAGVRLDDLGDSVRNIFLIGRPSAFVP